MDYSLWNPSECSTVRRIRAGFGPTAHKIKSSVNAASGRYWPGSGTECGTHSDVFIFSDVSHVLIMCFKILKIILMAALVFVFLYQIQQHAHAAIWLKTTKHFPEFHYRNFCSGEWDHFLLRIFLCLGQGFFLPRWKLGYFRLGCYDVFELLNFLDQSHSSKQPIRGLNSDPAWSAWLHRASRPSQSSSDHGRQSLTHLPPPTPARANDSAYFRPLFS